jgi:hypothetical protein
VRHPDGAALLGVVSALPALLVIGVLVVIACASGVAAALLDVDLRRLAASRRRRLALLERQKDIAAGLGWPWQRWVGLRLGCVAAGLAAAWVTGVALLFVIGPVAGWVGTGFALSGVAANRRLRMERAFLGQMRSLRDRMAISNQSLDAALQELGRQAGAELAHVMAPLARPSPTVANVVEMGLRARSPIVEQAAAIFVWSRSRSSEFLIQTIDRVLIPVGEAQIAMEEEGLVTLSQQRAVAVAMASLLGIMLFLILRVDSLRAFYQTFVGQLWLLAVFTIFAVLVVALGMIVRPRETTRWDLRRLADEQDRLHA